MSREIKFRALCEVDTNKGTETKMVYFSHCELDNGLWFKPDDDNKYHINEWLTKPMQNTGLKDKNGKDIYEGDIVFGKDSTFGNSDPKKWIVEWINGGFMYSWKDYPRITRANIKDLEVTGNIHEEQSKPTP